jgi:hypothetical protein
MVLPMSRALRLGRMACKDIRYIQRHGYVDDTSADMFYDRQQVFEFTNRWFIRYVKRGCDSSESALIADKSRYTEKNKAILAGIGDQRWLRRGHGNQPSSSN